MSKICLEADDVRPELLDNRRCAEIRRSMDRLGITLASVSYHGDKELPADRRANQERAIHIAHWLGTDILVLNSERSTDQMRQWDEHVHHFRTLCHVADALGVNLAIEPEPQLVVGSSQDMLDVLRLVDSPALKVNFDLGHAQVTDTDPATSIRLLGSAIVHLHLEDIKDRVHRHLLFGDGDIDFVSVRQALVDIGYDGPYVADLFGQADPLASATQTIGALRRLFN